MIVALIALQRILTLSTFTAALTCHECMFIESAPAFVAVIARQANIMDGAYNYGHCKSKHNSCFTNGSCINLITRYEISVMNIQYGWNLWKKGCKSYELEGIVNVTDAKYENGCREGNVTRPLNAYIQVNTQCICNDKDFCNFASSPSSSCCLFVIVFVVLLLYYC